MEREREEGRNSRCKMGRKIKADSAARSSDTYLQSGVKDTCSPLFLQADSTWFQLHELELDSWQLCSARKGGKEYKSHAATKCMMLISQIRESNVDGDATSIS